ncbi:MAG: FtsX-like permease family protein [Clostridia bacterium]|nr:FtsX-like permease family protein [Clostridia bacterium]
MKRMILPVIKKYKKLLLSIMIVSAMGCAFMTGLSGAYVSLEGSLNDYLEDYCYPDAFLTTDVTNRSKIDRLRELSSVTNINARLCGDTYLKSHEGRYLSVRVFSFQPDDQQQFHYWSQAESRGKDAIYLEYNFAHDNHIQAGDTVKVKVDDKYRKYFVAAIVSNPEAISVQPTDNSWGVNTDFGYAYAPVKLLTQEYEKTYHTAKEELDSKQQQLDKEWQKAQSKLNSAEMLISDAKQQLTDGQKLYEDSSLQAEKKLEQLTEAETELKSSQSDLLLQRQELSASQQTMEQALRYLTDNQEALQQAADNIQQIDEELLRIENFTAQISQFSVDTFWPLLSSHPEMSLERLLQAADTLRFFTDIIQVYGFSYDSAGTLSELCEQLTAYMNQVVSDYQYLQSLDVSELSESEREQLIAVVERYHLYSRISSLERNIENTQEVLSHIVSIIDEQDLYTTVSYLQMLVNVDNMEALLAALSDMKSLMELLSSYTGESIVTAGDLTAVYTSAVGDAAARKAQLTEQRQNSLSFVSSYGLTEDNLFDVPAFVRRQSLRTNSELSAIEESIGRIDAELSRIDNSLTRNADSRQKLLARLENAEKQLEDAQKTITENETKFIDERTKALTEFSDLKQELEKAYQQLTEGEGYDQLCNQFLIYFREGTDREAEVQKLKEMLSDEDVSVKSSYTFDTSAVKKRIDDNLKAIETMSILMPAIFFGIILIVVFLFMSLIIKQSRREIGILRALGFTKGHIKRLFCSVNLVVSLCAIVLGVAMGYGLMRYVGDYYAAFFPLPSFTFRFNGVMFALSAVLTVVVGQIATLISAGSIARVLPSEAMSRPAPETTSIPRFLQKLTAKASPMTKFSIAILVRNKMRFVFSVVCIASSVMMIFSSLAFITSKNYLLHQLYDERIRYDCQIFFKEDPSAEFMEELNGLGFIKDVQKLPFYQKDITFNGKTERAVINALDRDTTLIGVYGSDQRPIAIPEQGIILEKHTAQSLGAGVGDTVDINGQEVTVTAISDQCVSQFQYMSYEAAQQLGDMTIGSVIGNIDELDEQELLAFLSEKDNYLYTVFTRLAYQGNEKIFKTYDLAAWIIIGFAIVIGLVIVINIAQTNLLEKKRELCVLRTLGFQHGEISRKWFVQSFLQFIFSCIIGLPIGIGIARFALQKLSTSAREYVFANSWTEYLFTILLVLAYVVVSHLIAMRSMKKWNLAESVKDKE